MGSAADRCEADSAGLASNNQILSFPRPSRAELSVVSRYAYPFAVLLNPLIPIEPFGPTGHNSSSLSSSLDSPSTPSSSPNPRPPSSSSLSLSELSITSLLLPNRVGSFGWRGRRWTGFGVKAGPVELDVEATEEADRTDEAEPLPLRRGIRRGALGMIARRGQPRELDLDLELLCLS